MAYDLDYFWQLGWDSYYAGMPKEIYPSGMTTEERMMWLSGHSMAAELHNEEKEDFVMDFD